MYIWINGFTHENFFAQLLQHAWRVGDLTLFEALTGGAFDRLNWQYSGEFDQNFSKKSNARGFARGGGDGRFWNWLAHYIEGIHFYYTLHLIIISNKYIKVIYTTRV